MRVDPFSVGAAVDSYSRAVDADTDRQAQEWQQQQIAKHEQITDPEQVNYRRSHGALRQRTPAQTHQLVSDVGSALIDPAYYKEVGHHAWDALGRNAAMLAGLPVDAVNLVTDLPKNTSGGLNFGSEDMIARAKHAGFIGDTPNTPADIAAMVATMSPTSAARVIGRGAKIAGPLAMRGAKAVAIPTERAIVNARRPYTDLQVTTEGVSPNRLQNTAHVPHLSKRAITLAQRELPRGSPLSDAALRDTEGGYFAGETNPMFVLQSRLNADNPELISSVKQLGSHLGQDAMAGNRFIPLTLPGTRDLASSEMLHNISAEDIKTLAPLADKHSMAAAARPNGGMWLAPYDTSAGGLDEFRNVKLKALADEYGVGMGDYSLGVTDPNLDRFYVSRREYGGASPLAEESPLAKYYNRIDTGTNYGFGVK